MSTANLDPLLRQAERRAILTVLRDHPRWTLGDLFDSIEHAGPRAAMLRELRLEELLRQGPLTSRELRSGTEVDEERLQAARRATGMEFDGHVRAVLEEHRRAADKRGGAGWVAAGFLRERVGGPRWKLQASLGRLVDDGLVERTGKTSSTRYRRLVPDGAGQAPARAGRASKGAS